MDITFNQDFILDFVNVIAALFVGLQPLLIMVIAMIMFNGGVHMVISWIKRVPHT
jgi:hypothetical protein